MAKVPPKKTKSPPKKKATRTVSPEKKLLKANEEALKKLQTLGIENQLQADIEWCLGSFSYDHNPVGLYQTAKKALAVFSGIKKKEPKKVPAKLIQDLQGLTAG